MLILSIPFVNPGFAKKHSANSSFIWKEYRLDYHKDLSVFPSDILDANSIVTIRDNSEGGINKIPILNKIRFYQEVISEYNCLVDYEIQLYKVDSIKPDNLVLSYHDFSEQCDFAKLEKMILKMNAVKAKLAKIAVNINTYSQILQIYNLIQQSNKPVIFAGMGKLGKISRMLYKHLGASGTFAGLEDNRTAEGQLTEYDVELFNLKSISSKSMIGGIIGGKQVEKSLGLRYYNECFQQNCDAFYFPFVVDEIDDFKTWLAQCAFKDIFYGFSITMPFKKQLSENKKAYNLYLPRQNKFFNTDIDAFAKSLDQLGVKLDSSILIIGNGGSAAAIMSTLKNYTNVSIYARREKNNISTGRKYLTLDKAQNMEFDLLINCTPIGMNEEDFVQKTGIRNFQKIIDLPYQTKNTKLITYCLQNQLPFISGEKFWQWQAEKQLASFKTEINDRNKYLSLEQEKNREKNKKK